MKKGEKMSDEQKAKIAKAHTGMSKPWSGKWMTDEDKKKISERTKGNQNCLGRKLSQESIEKIRQSNLGKKHNISEESLKKMQIKNYDVWNKGMVGYMSGEQNPAWIKDRTLLKKSDRQAGSAYTLWRKEVYKRDNYTCKISNEDCSNKIEAHHILTWKNHPELRYEVNNGITLCTKHHPRQREAEIKFADYFRSLIS